MTSNTNDFEQLGNSSYQLNITPKASILNVFSRLSYKPWYAIAEFVDNSTQSYLSNEEALKENLNFKKLKVKVNYNPKENTLIIEDNAFGMDFNRFKDAILLDSRNETQVGRNEFGMGLKTAASWFGNVWTITSTQYLSNNQYTATINIPDLKLTGNSSIEIYREEVDPYTHGTILEISDVTKKITGARTIGKIKDLLASMYRRDINNRNIEILFNNEPISFENYPILSNFRGKTWKKNLDFLVEFEDKNYHVTGFVAIMSPGSFNKAGFALFRQDRVVIGGTDLNYKPSQIFGQYQSQCSLKLFGELNMDDFPVNQAKDGFVWDGELEEAFIIELKNNIQEYIEIANLSVKERVKETEFSEEASNKLQKTVDEVIEKLSEGFSENLQKEDSLNVSSSSKDETEIDNYSDLLEYQETILNNDLADVQEKIVGPNRKYTIPINAFLKREVNVQWAIGKKDYWLEYKESEGVIEVLINIDHPFFKPYSNEENFKVVLEKLVLAFVVAEQQAKASSDKEGYILVTSIKNKMNEYLSRMVND